MGDLRSEYSVVRLPQEWKGCSMKTSLKTTRDVPYVVDGDRSQMLDVYLPEGAVGPFPTLMMIHGNGFSSGDKSRYGPLAYHFAERGYASVAVNYRLLPQFRYPAQVQDVFWALGWIHANAHFYGFDPERIVALGSSAGAILAAMLGTVGDATAYLEGHPYRLPDARRILGVVSFYGAFDCRRAPHHEGIIRYLGVEMSEAPEVWAEAYPESWIDGSEPSFLLVHDINDTGIPSTESENFAAALEAAGVRVELLLVSDAHGHFNAERPLSPASAQSLGPMDAFLADLFGE
jgi:acetyl esterase/lipase